MSLDDPDTYPLIDLQNMISHIDNLPDYLEASWQMAFEQNLPDYKNIQHVLFAGMGGSAIGADLLCAYLEPICHLPLIVHRDYGLPAWASGPETFVIITSHSGNTEEALSAFNMAVKNKCSVLAISSGGQLEKLSQQHGVPFWKYSFDGQPRSAVGHSFAIQLAALSRLSLVEDPSKDLADMLIAMRKYQSNWKTAVAAVNNPAKRLAGQLIGRWVAVFGTGALAPVARRWKCQISEIAKAWAQFEYLPEADHNTLAGLQNPEDNLNRLVAIFLRSESDHPRNKIRIQKTKEFFMLQGLGTDFVDALGESRLAHQWTALHFGDYVAYYLAMAYQVDPTPVEIIEDFKRCITETNQV